MFTFISSRLSLETIQHGSLFTDYISDASWKYAKVALVALSIIGAVATLIYMYRSYSAKELKPEESTIPSDISPKTAGEDKATKDAKKKEEPKDSKKEVVPPVSQEEEDAKLAAKLMQEELNEQEDARHARMLDHEYKQDLSKIEDLTPPSIMPTIPRMTFPITKPTAPIIPAPKADPSKQDDKDDKDYLLALKLQNEELDTDTDIDTDTTPHSAPGIVATPTIAPIAVPTTAPIAKMPIAGPASKPVAAPIPATVVTSGVPLLLPSTDFARFEKTYNEISGKIFTDPAFSVVDALRWAAPFQLKAVSLLNEIMTEFETRYSISVKYAYRTPVPNNPTLSDQEKKYFSLAGIQSLIAVGPAFVEEFRKTQFLAGEHNYPVGGLKRFKSALGNTISFETPIQAKDDAEAIEIAHSMIVTFGSTYLGIKKADITSADVAAAFPKRKLEIQDSVVPEAQSDKDCANHGLWKRTDSEGKTTYYVNVPNMDIVLTAILKLPYQLAELAYLTKEKNGGKLTKEFFDELFEKGISEKDFNDKTSTFMQFYDDWKIKLA